MTDKHLKLAKEKGKYGYKDEDGNWIVKPIFMKADEFERGMARVQLDGMWGFLNEDGGWIVEPTLSEASPFSDELARVKRGLFYGFINRKGEWFIEPKLLKATDFENGTLAFVEDLDSKCAFISNKGKMITDFNLDSMAYRSSDIFMTDNRIRAKKEGKYGFLDEKGNWVVAPVYEEVFKYEDGRAFVKHHSEGQNDYCYDLIDLDGNVILESIDLVTFNNGFENGLAVVRVPACEEDNNLYVVGKCGVIDRDGKWVVPPTFGKIQKFNNGFAITVKGGYQGVVDKDGNVILDNIYDSIYDREDHFVVKLNKKTGIADKTGKIILAPKYEGCYLRKDGFIQIRNKKYGLADPKGKVVIKPILESTPEFDDTGYARVEIQGKYGWINRKGKYLTEQLFDDIHDFSEGMAAVKTGEMWGFIDDNGNFAIEPQFDFVRDFKNGISTVAIAGHWGIISKSGEWLAEPKFDEIKEFADGMAPAKTFNLKARASKWGMIDEKAQYVIEPEFEDLDKFQGSYAKAKANGKWGLIDKKGNWIVKPEFDKIKNFTDGLAHVIKDGLTGLINEEGETIVEPKYDEIFEFTDAGVAEVEIKRKYGFINREGKEIVAPNIKEEDQFNTETRYLWAKVKGKWGYLDSNGGRWVIEPKYETVYVFDFIKAEFDGKWGVIDYRGNWLVPPILNSDNDLTGIFNHGLIRVKAEGKEGYYDILEKKWALPIKYEKAEYLGENLFIVKEKGKFAFSDSEGQICDGKWYDDIFQGPGVVWVKENGKYGVFDKSLTGLLSPTFDWVDFNHILFYRDGIIRVKIDGRMALADIYGNILGDRTYDGMHEYRDRHFKVVDKGRMGLIDEQGSLIIPTEYYEVEPFYNGLSLVVTLDNKYGFIGEDGKWVIHPEFDWSESFHESRGGGILKYVRAKVDGMYGVINRKGEWIIEPKFEKIGSVSGILAVKENGKWGYYNLFGDWIVPPIYMEADDFCNGYGSVLDYDFNRFYVNTEGKLYKRKPN